MGQPLDPTDPHSTTLPINPDALDETVMDPCHALNCTTLQIFGTSDPSADAPEVVHV